MALQVSENQSDQASTLHAHGISAETNLKQGVRERGRQLENFTQKSIKFTHKNDHGKVCTIKKCVVFAPDLAGLIEVVQEECRVMFGSQKHHGLDGGGGFLKPCLIGITDDKTQTQSPVSKKLVGGDRF